jgi:hypothetical protein
MDFQHPPFLKHASTFKGKRKMTKLTHEQQVAFFDSLHSITPFKYTSSIEDETGSKERTVSKSVVELIKTCRFYGITQNIDRRYSLSIRSYKNGWSISWIERDPEIGCQKKVDDIFFFENAKDATDFKNFVFSDNPHFNP